MKFRLTFFCLLVLWVLFSKNYALEFSDVSEHDSFSPSVQYLSEIQVFRGYGDGMFRPDQIINRAEALKVVLSIINIPEEEKKLANTFAVSFSDVSENAWFLPFLKQGVALGIVDGSAEKFFPERPVNRAEFFKMVITAFDIDLSHYEFSVPLVDVPPEAWFSPYFQFFVIEKIFTPSPESTVNPGALVSRGEGSELIFRFLQQGQGLEKSILIRLSTQKINKTIDQLISKNGEEAEKSLKTAKKWAQFFLASDRILDKNVIFLEQVTKTLEHLVKGYQALENKNFEVAITEAKTGWHSADILEDESFKFALKQFANGIAEVARDNS